MDANQTRFHLLLDTSDWARCTAPDGMSIFSSPESPVSWVAERRVVTLRSELFQYVASSADTRPQLGTPDGNDSDRRGADQDRFGNWYFISPNRLEILVNSSGSRTTSHFWSTHDFQPSPDPVAGGEFGPETNPIQPKPRELSGLAVTEDHYLVAGTLEPPGLLVFDLFAGGPPRQRLWPAGVPFSPFDMAARPGGGVWILDRAHKNYWAMDRQLRVETRDQALQQVQPPQPDLFQPTDQARVHCSKGKWFPLGLCIEDASPVSAADPVAIEALPDGSVLILDSRPGQSFCRVLRYSFGMVLGHSVGPESMAETVDPLPDRPFELHGYDFAFSPQTNPGTGQLGLLFFVGDSGNQAFAFRLTLVGDQIELEPQKTYFPMRLFGGMALVTALSQTYYDSNGRWMPLVDQARPRYVEAATLLTPVFDGREPQCVWHRLMLDACIPPDASVEVWSRASDDRDGTSPDDPLRTLAWQQEPALYRRGDGSELPFQTQPQSSNAGTFELLFQKATGRYLQIQLRLTGNRRVTPELRALRLYYPRFSYLRRYLPAVYREEPGPASFLDRFLANFEGFNTVLEDRIVAARALFDVRSAPAEALEWLASWFGVVLDPAWSERRRRLFIGHAMDYFQWRGTPRGLTMALRLIFEDNPDDGIFAPPGSTCNGTCCGGNSGSRYRIVETFLTRKNPGVIYGDPTSITGIGQVEASGRWLPEKGLAELENRYRRALNNSELIFNLDIPQNPTLAAARANFAQLELGFIPSDNADEGLAWRNFLRSVYADSAELSDLGGVDPIPIPDGQPQTNLLPDDWKAYQQLSPIPAPAVKRRMWQDFLAARYSNVSELNSSHQTFWSSFDVVAYPVSLRDGPLLADWFYFESLVLPTLASAHQFTVLLPFSGGTPNDQELRQQQLQLAERLIALEKPAHTTFSVKFYWALFRVGEARLGTDTLLGLGGREPALLTDAVLGRSYLSEARLAAGPTRDTDQRQILNRDRLP